MYVFVCEICGMCCVCVCVLACTCVSVDVHLTKSKGWKPINSLWICKMKWPVPRSTKCIMNIRIPVMQRSQPHTISMSDNVRENEWDQCKNEWDMLSNRTGTCTSTPVNSLMELCWSSFLFHKGTGSCSASLISCLLSQPWESQNMLLTSIHVRKSYQECITASLKRLVQPN